jgi:hypothetical protein
LCFRDLKEYRSGRSVLTQHARDALLKRKISIAWLERVLQLA